MSVPTYSNGVPVGAEEGNTVDSDLVGVSDACTLELTVDEIVEINDGDNVGLFAGEIVGFIRGLLLGDIVGTNVGDIVGFIEEMFVGDRV